MRSTLRYYRNDAHVLGQLAASLTDVNRLTYNQLGSFHRDILQYVSYQFPNLIIDMDGFHQRIDNARYYVDKTNYVDLVNDHQDLDLPAHARSITIKTKDIISINSFEELCEKIYPNRDKMTATQPEIVIKTGIDSGGEGVYFVNSANFNLIRDKLIEEEMAYQKYGEDSNTRCIVQERLQLVEDSNLPPCVSINCCIGDENQIHILGAAGQVYKDPDKKHYIGSTWDAEDNRNIINHIGPDKILSLCRLFAREGYQGYLGFDFLMNNKHEYVSIFDCNPRLTANDLVYFMSSRLSQLGVPIQRLTNIGRSGLFGGMNIEHVLNLCNKQNILFTRDTGKGILFVPYLRGGYNPFFVNYEDCSEAIRWNIALQEIDKKYPSIYL